MLRQTRVLLLYEVANHQELLASIYVDRVSRSVSHLNLSLLSFLSFMYLRGLKIFNTGMILFQLLIILEALV